LHESGKLARRDLPIAELENEHRSPVQIVNPILLGIVDDVAVGELVDLDRVILGDVGKVLARAADRPEHLEIDAPRGFAQSEMLLQR